MDQIKKTVLIVEDEPSLQRALGDHFSREGISVLSAKNGQEGLEVALREHPGVILLDIVMPVMDGMTMLTKLREDVWGKDAHVILLTNLVDNKEIVEAMKTGVFDYLVKSDWKIDDVVEKVKQKLGIE
ncbi:hypothetical protein A2Z10_03755 [Candidatus Azambacteria bacterium RBG_16_47_10]|uniref:Response regulatory domain-containing protein n=1 Tax=Candidatus Azambacteria bacterium RBG_16_47_10 TaxID=1797292 RepID=A0A1F5AXV7_9BACT|nr:MAG: hypothetical protein A2Z10_03755 [Candidatus Azambacteria bacterium RBG_16_47_10]